MHIIERGTQKEGNGTMHEHETVRLGASQADRAAGVLTRAFDNDPIQRYVIPDEHRRARVAPWTFRVLVRYCLPYGGVYTTPDLGGVACWLPPGIGPTEPWGMLRSGMILAPFRLGPAASVRFARISGYMDAERKRNAPARHWYLVGIGVEPSRQGEGIGGALLKPALDRADADGLSCYLETQTERNVRFYERHGFEVASEGAPGGLRVWTMLRTPRPPAPDPKQEKPRIRRENNHAKEER